MEPVNGLMKVIPGGDNIDKALKLLERITKALEAANELEATRQQRNREKETQ